MPKLSPELEKLLAFVPEDQREGMTTVVTELHENGLRQDEFSRKMNEVTDLKKQYESGKSWVDDNRAYYKEAIAQRDAASQKAKELEQTISQLKAGVTPVSGSSGSAVNLENLDMDDPEKVAAAIRQVQQEAADARAVSLKFGETLQQINERLEKGDLVTRDVFETEGGKRLDAYGKAIMGVFSTINKAQQEYGLALTEDQILAEADKHNGDLDAAFNVLTAEKREEKMKEKWLADEKKKWEAEQAEKGFPTAEGAPPLTLGPMQKMVLQTKKPEGESEIDPSIPADGSGRLSHAIAQELRAEGKV